MSTNSKDTQTKSVDDYNFDDVEIEQVVTKKEKNEEYDETTTKYYTKARLEKTDPITFEKTDNAFLFYHKFNPFNGERGTIDETGPLCFDPDVLIHYFYENRLNHLWVEPYEEKIDTEYVNYTGYFDNGVGNGPEFNINGRGKHPEWYLFRLPIIDCYIPKGGCGQSVTMGPVLTNDELEMIEKLANKNKYRYLELFNKKRPSIKKIKELYENAITAKLDYKLNCKCVKKLTKL